jgi:hypothetical protein
MKHLIISRDYRPQAIQHAESGLMLLTSLVDDGTGRNGPRHRGAVGRPGVGGSTLSFCPTACGWARERLPPFIIHFHTAAESIRRFAVEPGTPPDFIPMKRMAEFCIRAADALFCPRLFCPAMLRVLWLPLKQITSYSSSARLCRLCGARQCHLGAMEPLLYRPSPTVKDLSRTYQGRHSLAKG